MISRAMMVVVVAVVVVVVTVLHMREWLLMKSRTFLLLKIPAIFYPAQKAKEDRCRFSSPHDVCVSVCVCDVNKIEKVFRQRCYFFVAHLHSLGQDPLGCSSNERVSVSRMSTGFYKYTSMNTIYKRTVNSSFSTSRPLVLMFILCLDVCPAPHSSLLLPRDSPIIFLHSQTNRPFVYC